MQTKCRSFISSLLANLIPPKLEVGQNFYCIDLCSCTSGRISGNTGQIVTTDGANFKLDCVKFANSYIHVIDIQYQFQVTFD